MKRFLMLAVVLAMVGGAADAKIICKDPKTHKFMKCPPAAGPAAPSMSSAPSKPAASSSMMSSSKPPKHCVKGKACGNTCIAMADVCHK
jgi:hypothetical protein